MGVKAFGERPLMNVNRVIVCFMWESVLFTLCCQSNTEPLSAPHFSLECQKGPEWVILGKKGRVENPREENTFFCIFFNMFNCSPGCPGIYCSQIPTGQSEWERAAQGLKGLEENPRMDVWSSATAIVLWIALVLWKQFEHMNDAFHSTILSSSWPVLEINWAALLPLNSLYIEIPQQWRGAVRKVL